MPTMRSYLMCGAAALALALNAAAVSSAGAQAKPASVTPSKNCEKAIRLAVQGHFRREEDEDEERDREKGPKRSKTDWMWDVLPNCGAAGGVAAGAV